MRPAETEARQRACEVYHAMRAAPGGWLIARVDGRSFSKLTARRYAKPFDSALSRHMVAAATALLETFGGLLVYTHSDEASLVLSPAFDDFDRSVEKLVSLTAATATAAFVASAGHVATFDSRLWVGNRVDDVVDYLAWRHADAVRCALNGHAYAALRADGLNARQATARLESLSGSAKNELLFERGVNFDDTPLWQRRGVVVRWEEFAREGVDPRTGVVALATRRRIVADDELPTAAAFRRRAAELLGAPAAAAP